MQHRIAAFSRRKLLALALVAFTQACGGGSGGGTTASSPAPAPAPAPSNTFSVYLSGVDVRRVSNGQAIAVNTAAVTSGPLTLRD